MKDNNIYNEQIDRFLKGQMSIEEEQQFKTEIGQNPELKKQVREHLYLIRGIKQVKGQEEKSLIQNNQHAQKIIPLRRNWIRITGIAASIAIIMVLTGIEGSRLYYQHEIRHFAYNASVSVMTDFAAASRGTMDEETKDARAGDVAHRLLSQLRPAGLSGQGQIVQGLIVHFAPSPFPAGR